MSVNKTVRIPGSRSSGATPREQNSSRRIRLDVAPEKSVCQLRLDLNNLPSDEAVCFTVAGVCCFGIWCLDETENFPTLLVNPVLQVVNTVLLLRFEVGHVRLCDVLHANLPKLVNVHV